MAELFIDVAPKLKRGVASLLLMTEMLYALHDNLLCISK